jgi:carbon storage regulator CsrA
LIWDSLSNLAYFLFRRIGRLPVYYDSTTEFVGCKAYRKEKCVFGEKICGFTTLIVDSHGKFCARKGVTMLVLSRKKDETIILKGPDMSDIKITVVRIDNRNKVRIGIEADKEVTVLRSELNEGGTADTPKKKVQQISL